MAQSNPDKPARIRHIGRIALLSLLWIIAGGALQQQRGELAHLGRVASMSELSGSLAHELNQPLTAILSNAQAAQRFMEQDPPDLAEVREILTGIVSEDRRAGEVIRRMRGMLKKG